VVWCFVYVWVWVGVDVCTYILVLCEWSGNDWYCSVTIL